MGSEWPSTLLGISAQIKLSDEYLHPENQCQLILKIAEYSNPTDQEQFGALILKWVR